MLRSVREGPAAVTQSERVVGAAGFPALLIDAGSISRADMMVAEQHAAREHIDLAESIVALGLVAERATYEALARAAGAEFVSLADETSSELALRLVPERLARRYLVVPLRVDNRTLTFATSRPFQDECDHAMRLVEDGLTSLEEVDRVIAEDDQAKTAKTTSRVLITDDEPITRMLVKLLLEREHFEVLEAANGRQAVEIAQRERPDLMLIDLNMPEMDGYEAIGRLRRDFTLATLPIVVLTSEEGPGVERRVLELGADDYIVKPFDPAVLLSRVQAVFRRIKAVAA